MTEPQRKQLLDLVSLYVTNMDEGHARVKMDEVRRFADRTWFAWIGTTDPNGVFYYRVHSPVILIEFDHQVPANLKQYAKDPNAPNHEHIHTVLRTPNGNDYGKDLLRLHYLQHPHGTGQQQANRSDPPARRAGCRRAPAAAVRIYSKSLVRRNLVDARDPGERGEHGPHDERGPASAALQRADVRVDPRLRRFGNLGADGAARQRAADDRTGGAPG